MRKLTLSSTDKKICGVCGGIGEYLDVDSTFVRLGAIALFCCCGMGLLAYLLCAIIMPKE